MKQNLLFLTTLLFTFFSYAQVANQPDDLVVCDDNQDGLTASNLNVIDTQILSGQSTSNFSLSYHLTQVEANTGSNTIVNTTNFSNTTNPQTIFARLVDNSTGNYDTTSFNLSVALAPNINQNLNFEWCTSFGDFLPIGEVQYGYNVINNENSFDYTFTFYETLEDANADSNAIPDPFNYYNTNYYTTFYVAAVSNITSCRAVAPIELYYYEAYIYNNTPLEMCNTVDTATFNLELNKTLNFISYNDVISYHLTENDAYNNINELPLQYQNISNPQTIYIRLENENFYAGDCYAIEPLDLIVNIGSSVTANSIEDQTVCGTSLNYDLTIHESEITGSQTGVSIAYYYSLNNLLQETNAIQNPETITLNQNFNNRYFVRVDGDASDCYNTTEINVAVQNALPLDASTLFNCNTLTYNLQYALDEITNSFDGNITLHETEADALANSNAIANITSYTATSNNQVLFSSALVTAQCYGIGTVELINETGLVIVAPEPLEVCEDIYNANNSLVNDGFMPFDLTSKSIEILGENNPLNYTVHYYETFFDSQNDTNSLEQNGLYTNIVQDSQTVYVRINSNNTDCFALTTLELIVHYLPEIIAPTPLLVCDEDGDGILEFNLDSKINEISNGVTDVVITFHVSFDDANNNSNPITGLYGTPGTVLARGTTSNGCYVLLPLDLIVIDCPIVVTCGTPINTSYCYIDEDTTQYLFESDNGQPLAVVINAGQVEVNYDELIVLDSDGVTNLNENNPFGNDGDVSGLTFLSTGSSITVFVNADYIYSCSDQGYTNLDFDVFCADGIINVEAFRDYNYNSVFDVSETNFTEGYFTYIKNNDGVINTINSSTGQFSIVTTDENDTYDITFNLYTENENCYDTSIPSFQNVTVSSGNSVNIQFPVVEYAPCEDVAVALYNFSQSPRTGFNYSNYLYIQNYGDNTVSSGSIEFVNDANVTYLAANNIPSSWTLTNTATGFTLDFVNLASNVSEQIEIVLNVPTTANIGDLITNAAMYTSATNDSNLTNNTTSLTETVVNSYDPNDISESHGREIAYANFTATDEYLYYTIRFQNIGTADAINVNIENTLNPLLDASTLRMLHSSHDVVMTETNGQLTFAHDTINLVSQAEDEEASKGFVYYKIKPVAGYNVGTIIPNTAEIYFDFNAPVITNTFETVFVEENLSVDQFNTNDFTLYPNPANSILNIKLNNALIGNATVQVIDVQGKMVISTTLNQTLQLDVKSLMSGLYFVKLKYENTQTVKKLIIE